MRQKVTVAIRPEREGDVAAIHRVVEAAFGRADEADLVDALRQTTRPFLSLVAEAAGALIGHVAFTPVRVDGRALFPPALGLAPLAVRPDMQRSGVGSQLTRAGLGACRELGAPFVVVLGHPPYYPRFGFTPAAGFGLTYAEREPTDAFMALELIPGALRNIRGRVDFAPAFRD